MRSSSPALIDFDAIIGNGLVCFCSIVTGLQDKQHMEQKKKHARDLAANELFSSVFAVD